MRGEVGDAELIGYTLILSKTTRDLEWKRRRRSQIGLRTGLNILNGVLLALLL